MGKLSLVDLAGSERVGKTGAEGERMAEAKAINKYVAPKLQIMLLLLIFVIECCFVSLCVQVVLLFCSRETRPYVFVFLFFFWTQTTDPCPLLVM